MPTPESPSRPSGPVLSREEEERYHRQIMLPEIGQKGQRRLKAARVCIVGLGGLGSISAMGLAAAGIGYLRIVDRDRVELGNLNRQVLHGTPDVGRFKADSGRERLLDLNPKIQIDARVAEVTVKNAVDVVGDCALIVDGTDNLATRKALNQTAVQKGIPFVYGGVDGFEGMVTTIVPGASPCLECLFPGEDRAEDREIGVPGPMPGLVASLQALEAVKLLAGIDPALSGRLLLVRALGMSFHDVQVDRNPQCTVCGSMDRNER